MYNVTIDYLTALEHHNLQRVYGNLVLSNGTSIALNDNNIIGNPSIETQIVDDSEVFNISCLYIGTLDMTLKIDVGELDLIGAEITLYTRILFDDGETWSSPVPMGVFDVADAQRQSEYVMKITGYDHMARLNVPLPDNSYGELKTLSTIIIDIMEYADIIFAQTWREISELNPYVDITVFEYAETCWKQVQYIAQILGCYVIANRSGEIEFRPYTNNSAVYPVPVITISADERHSAKISQYKFGVRCFGYTDKFGHTQLSSQRERETYSIIYIPQENNIIKDRNSSWELYYSRFLNWLYTEFAFIEWNPGTINYYGNPALDVGDMVALTGGINGNRTTNFLICHNTWQFRGPQTLISGGAPRSGNTVSSSGGGGGNVYTNTVMNITKEIVLASFTGYLGELFGNIPRTAAQCRFSAKEETAAFITCTMTFTGSASAQIVRNGVPMDIEPLGTGTISFTIPYMAGGGVHDISILMSGNGELTAVQGAVWGQNIIAQELVYSDWEYEIENDTATITGYSGDDTSLIVPANLGGKPVVKIGEGALAENSDIITVYIPDGIEIIE